MDGFKEKGKLPRLPREHYQGRAVVFWTNTLEERARGWLTPAFHINLRELMMHAAARERLYCPAYCLMPDHLHFIWMGLNRESDQLNAISFLRKYLEPVLGDGRAWQHQAHDHVIRGEERRRNAFARFCYYTLSNPVRDKLVKRPHDWVYSGGVIPGYPVVHPLEKDYWELFWKLYVKKLREEDYAPPSDEPRVGE